jgi:hypothetical protein
MKYLVPLAKGEVIGAFVYQSQKGSDATSQNNSD